jgi:hypothetical protein
VRHGSRSASTSDPIASAVLSLRRPMAGPNFVFPLKVAYGLISFQYPNYEGKFSIVRDSYRICFVTQLSILQPFPVSGLSLEVASDLIITLSMVHYLVVPVRGSTVKR